MVIFSYVSLAILLLAPLGMWALRVLRPGFVYHWLLAAAAALFAWLLLLLVGLQLPESLVLIGWRENTFFTASIGLELDQYSWPLAIAVATLVLAMILTDVARASEAEWSSWASGLLLGALGITAVLAANPLTLLLAWTAIDLVELVILLAQVYQSKLRRQVVVVLSTRMLGSAVLVAAGIAAAGEGENLGFAGIPAVSLFLLLVSAGLRLGVLPLHLPFLREPQMRPGPGTILRLVPSAAALILVVRIAAIQQNAPQPFILSTLLLALLGLTSIFASVAWSIARSELESRWAWITGMACLAVGAAIRGSSSASLAWGMAAILDGGLIFLASARARRLAWILWIGLLALSTLPFTPTWQGSFLYAWPLQPVLILLLISQAFLLLGFARHMFEPGDALQGAERWVWVVYPAGLILLPLTHFGFGFWSLPALADVPLAGWLVGPLIVALAVPGFWLRDRERQLTSRFLARVRSILSFSWLYAALISLYHLLERFMRFVTLVLEGQGGILWALLWVVLLFALIWSGLGG